MATRDDERIGPNSPTADAEPAATAVADEPEGGHGRIGYGRLARFTPLALAALLVVGLAAIGLARQAAESPAPYPPPPAGALRAGAAAPDVTLTLLDGTPLRLADLRGSVVVVNFWGSFCAPCREEMPILQAYADEAARSGERTAIVGVGVRTDVDADARALVRELGLSYPIGRDTAIEGPGEGPIQRAFGLGPFDFLPATFVVRPDGVVDRLHVGPLSAEQLREAVATARAAAE
jgi:thiol-disulfide isomerase/thioredoxin